MGCGAMAAQGFLAPKVIGSSPITPATTRKTMECITVGAAIIFALYMISNKKRFCYCGTDEQKYDEAFIAILIKE